MKHLHSITFTSGLLLFLIALLLVPPVQADGWPQRRRHGYFKLGFRTFRAANYYEPNGNRIAIPTVSDYVISLYGEYGITDRLTGIAYLPFFERITRNEQVGRSSGFVFTEGSAVTDIADAVVGVRFGLLTNGPTVLSAGLKLGLPLGDAEEPTGLNTGDGELNQLLTLEAGHSFYPIPAYALATVGFNQRVKGYSDEFVYHLEAGYTVANALTIIGRVRGVEPFRNGDDAVGSQSGFYGNNQRYMAYGMELAYTHRSGLGLSAGVEGATRAQNVLSAAAFSFGIFLVR